MNSLQLVAIQSWASIAVCAGAPSCWTKPYWASWKDFGLYESWWWTLGTYVKM